MTKTADLVSSIQNEKNVVAQWFTREHVEEHLALTLTDEEWDNLTDWFDESGWADEVSELFFSYLHRAIHEKD